MVFKIPIMRLHKRLLTLILKRFMCRFRLSQVNQSEPEHTFINNLLLWLGVLSISTLSIAPAAYAQSLDDLSPATKTFAIENATIVQQPGRTINRGTVVIRDGLILDVGRNVDVPFDAERIAGDSLTIYAGFIDGLSHAGMPEPPKQEFSTSGPNKVSRANPPNDIAGIQPDRSAMDVLDAEEKSIEALRKVGFTAAHVVPQGRMLPGTGAIILLAGDHANDMLLKQDVSMFAQMTGASRVYPATPMGVMAKMRQLYKESARRKQMETLYASNESNMPRPNYDAAHYAFFPVIDGDLPIYMNTTSALDIYRALRLKKTLGYPLVLTGLYGGFESIDLLLDADVPLFLSLKTPKKIEKKKEDEETETEPAPYDPTLHVTDHTNTDNELINLEARRKIFHDEYLATAATMYDAGLNFGFSTKDVKPADIHGNIRKMISHGLTTDIALAALTTIPAEILGLSNSMGTVEKGKMANLVISKGPIFSESSKIKFVFVDGQKFELEEEEAKKK